jgi:hypothetical protein
MARVNRVTAGLYMKLDRMERVSGRAPKQRTLRGASKVLLLLQAGRLVWGLLIIVGVAAWVKVNVVGSEAGPRFWFAPEDAAAAGLEKPAEDARLTILFGGAFLVAAGLMIASGVRRIRRAVWVAEHGVDGVATVVEIRQSTKWITRGPRSVFTIQWVVSCELEFARKGRRRFELFAASGETVKRGDRLAVWYDPGMPRNVLVVDALPRAVLAGID